MEKRQGNAYNNNTLNAYNTNKLRDSQTVPQNTLFSPEDLNVYEIPKQIMNILHSLKETGKFRTGLPIPGRKPSKIVLNCINYLKEIKAGTFVRSIDLDPVWSKKFVKVYPSNKGYPTWREVKNIVIDAVVLMVSESKQGWLPKDMDQFFISGKFGGQAKSMFLKYFGKEDDSTVGNKVVWQQNLIPENVKSPLSGFLEGRKQDFTDYNLVQFWSNMNILCTWYEKNYSRLDVYNKAFNDNGFGYHCGSLESFIGICIEYLKKLPKIYDRPMMPDSDNFGWVNFITYMRENFNIELNPNKEQEKEATRKIQEKKSTEVNEKISNVMAQIKAQCIENDVEVPDFETLKIAALKRINSKE